MRVSTASIVISRVPSVRDVGGRDAVLVEVRLEHLQRGGRRGGAAVAAVLDHGADDDRRVVGRPVAAPPRLVQLHLVRIAGQADQLLGRPGLAGDRDREVAEDAVRGAERRMRARVEPFLDGLERRRVDPALRRLLGRELTQDLRRLRVARRLLDVLGDMGASRAARRSRSSRRSAPSAAASPAGRPGRSRAGPSSRASRSGRSRCTAGR